MIRANQTVSVKISEKDIPKVIFPIKTVLTMEYIIDKVNTEVGWLGTVSRNNNTYVIDDILIPEQEVHMSTCELLGPSILNIAEELESRGESEKIGRIRFWGHSHHNMSAIPSSQDYQTLTNLAKDCSDYFIGAICNKKNEMFVIFINNMNKITIENIDWSVDMGINRKEIEDRIDPILKKNIKTYEVSKDFIDDLYDYKPDKYKKRSAIITKRDDHGNKLPAATRFADPYLLY